MIATRHAMAAEDLHSPDGGVARHRRSLADARQAMSEWPARTFFGVLLAGVAVAATFGGGFYFAGFLAVVAVAGAREWHRMVSGKRFGLELILTSVSIAGALAAVVVTPRAIWPTCALALGCILAAAASYVRNSAPLWSGSGALYVGAPAACLVALRMDVDRGPWVVLGLFITVWAADSGAFLMGRFVGGPKLVPVLSPNKTWAGMAGGIVLPAAALSLYVSVLGGNGWKAGLLGVLLAVAGHAGDLFESWVKRRVGRKNSGSLIPGHGGVLDRVDSTLFAAPLAAVLVFVFGLDPLFGAHP